MFQLTKLRRELDFNKEIGGIISVLRGVATSEFYHLRKARKKLDEFGNYLQGFFQMVNIAGLHHAFLEVSSLPPALVLITSDAGLLGKLNILVVNSALEQFSGDGELIVVGRQGARYIEETGKSFTSFAGISDEVNYQEAEKLGDYIVKGILDKKLGRTVVVYPHFVSFTVWEVQTYQMLPCRFLFREDLKHREEEEEKIIVEPSMSRIIEYLVRVWIIYMLYGIFWESKLTEWSARVVHLERSSEEVKQQSKELNLKYFRLIHELSDKNIREIFSSRLAAEKARL
jgi:ATP synthase F1 gamma subunit